MALWRLVLITCCGLKGTTIATTSTLITTSLSPYNTSYNSPYNSSFHTLISSHLSTTLSTTTHSHRYRSSSFPSVTPTDSSTTVPTTEEEEEEQWSGMESSEMESSGMEWSGMEQSMEDISLIGEDERLPYDQYRYDYYSKICGPLNCTDSYVVEMTCERLHNCCGPCEGLNTTLREYYFYNYMMFLTEPGTEPGTNYTVTVKPTWNSTLSHKTNTFKDKQEINCEEDLVLYDYPWLKWRDPCLRYTGNLISDIWLNETRLNVSTCSNSYNVTDLDLYTNYSLKVIYDGDKTCYLNVSTLLAVPTEPTNLTIKPPDFETSSKQSRMANITWSAPDHMNGKLKQYILTFHSETSSTKTSESYYTKECFYELELKPESSYSFSVRAENEQIEGMSPPITKNHTTTTGTPFFTDFEPLKYEKGRVTHNSITLTLNSTSISNKNGKVIKYMVWMQDGYNSNEMKYSTSARVVYCNTSSPMKEFPITIGEEKPTKGDCPENESSYSLEPKQWYTFSIRIYTKNHFKASNIIQIETSENPKFQQLYIVLIITIILLLGVTAAYIIHSRRFKAIKCESMELPMVVSSSPDISVERRILLTDLPHTVEALFSRGETGLRKEYAYLKTVRVSKPCRHANLQGNREKSRYLNILPYDETRVVLKEYSNIPNSNFINASYIHGYSKPREFIACQGPLRNTVSDFWRMVWEKNVHVIVMVTQCIEMTKEKCSKYWPDASTSFTFRDFKLKVKHINEQKHQQDGYIHRTLQLSKMYEVRMIYQFHFALWPDMGSPSSPDLLINFVKIVKSQVPAASSHVIVHCSAGVGRTGTFIGLSNLMEEMEDQSSIDVFHTVYRMRLHRTNMVQTLNQYSFLYKCVLKYYLDLKGESHRWADIKERLESKEVIPDVINGTLTGSHNGNNVKMNDTSSTSEEEIE